LAERLDCVLGRLIWAGLKLAPGKCEFGTESVEFLGHVILHGQVTMSKWKTDAASKLLPPTNVNELQQDFELLQYYRNFIPKFAHLARHSNDQTSVEESPFCLDKGLSKFIRIPEEALNLCSYPVLTGYDPKLTLVLDIDYQKNATSAILGMRNPDFKREQVIEYASRALNATEQRLSATEGELAASIWGLKHFLVYLRGRPKFVIRTDHRALTWIKTLNSTSGKLARWLYTVQAEYHFEVEHREGKTHLKAESLSRAVASHLISRPLLEQDYIGNISSVSSDPDGWSSASRGYRTKNSSHS
jgi:hypothetical protein